MNRHSILARDRKRLLLLVLVAAALAVYLVLRFVG